MRASLAVLCLAACAGPAAAPDAGAGADSGVDPADEQVFTATTIHQIRFTMTAAALAAIDGDTHPEVHAAMVIDGAAYPDVGLKLKGSGSYQPMSGKPAFVVDLNEWVPGTRYQGLKAFKLHNALMLDPTRTHEFLSYQLARAAGLIAPRVGWAEVWCNDEPYGIYLLVEKHDDVLIAHHDPAQAELGVMLEPGGQFMDFGGSLAGDAEAVVLGMWDEGPLPPAAGVLDALVAVDDLLLPPAVAADADALWQRVDQDALLTYLAWEALITHLDGYVAAHNYRLFVDGATFQIEWVPSGADTTWLNDAEAFPSGVGAALLWCLAVPSCRRAYAEHLLEMADLVESLDLAGQYAALSAWLAPSIAADPRAGFSADEITATSASTATHLHDNPGRVRAQVHAEYPDLEP
jgi:spore coat protein CotH